MPREDSVLTEDEVQEVQQKISQHESRRNQEIWMSETREAPDSPHDFKVAGPPAEERSPQLWLASYKLCGKL